MKIFTLIVSAAAMGSASLLDPTSALPSIYANFHRNTLSGAYDGNCACDVNKNGITKKGIKVSSFVCWLFRHLSREKTPGNFISRGARLEVQ